MAVNKYILLAALSSLSLLVTPTSFAQEKECGFLQIQVANMTNKVCILQKKSLSHGTNLSDVPVAIRPGDSAVFTVEQAIMGPDLTLSYRCGDQEVQFESQQNKCILWSGNVTGTSLYEDLGIQAQHQEERGSNFWDHPGHITWFIINQ